MNKTQKSVVISTIGRTYNKRNPNLPGNLIINQGPKQLWLGAVDLRNMLIRVGLPTNVPLTAFVGARLMYNEITVTPEMLAASPAGVVVTSNGREITYKTPGVKQLEFEIDWNTIDIKENHLNQAKLISILGTGRRTEPVAPATQPNTQPETVGMPDEEVKETIVVDGKNVDAETGEAHEDLANAGKAVKKEQVVNQNDLDDPTE